MADIEASSETPLKDGELDLNTEAPDLIWKLAALRDSGLGMVGITVPPESQFLPNQEAIVKSYYMSRSDPRAFGVWGLDADGIKVHVVSYPAQGSDQPQLFGIGKLDHNMKLEHADREMTLKAREILLAFDDAMTLEEWQEVTEQRKQNRQSFWRKLFSKK